MKKEKIVKRIVALQKKIAEPLLMGLLIVVSNSVYADNNSWLPSNVTLGGFVRLETAIKTTDDENSNNQGGNPFNQRDEVRQPYLPPNASGTLLSNLNSLVPGLNLPTSVPTGNWQTLALPLANSSTRPVAPANNFFNLHILRAESEVGWQITSDLKFQARLRTVTELGNYDSFDAGSLANLQGGITGGNPSLYGGAPNYFQYQVEGNKHPNPLEWDGPKYQIYFPALFLDYSRGPLNIRLGEQSIAWGNAIFFRVFDTANGIDFRRHSILDYAQEEYSDKRVPAPALRVSYQVTDEVNVDGYVEKFQPTVYSNPNTQYNFIPSQFTVHDEYGQYTSKLNYAIRLRAEYSQWSFEAMAGRRYNPDGVFRWTASGVNKNFPSTEAAGGLDVLGTAVNATNVAGGNSGAGPILAQTPFEVAPGGVYSAPEWFHYAAQARLNGISALNASILGFEPATGAVYASPVTNYTQAYNELSTFFNTSGGSLRGHIARDYFQEYNYGLGAGFTTDGAPGSLLDQLLIHLEVSYTPDRVFTAPDLNQNFLHENSLIGALVLEKYYRFTQAFPATYFVVQYMHRTHDDLFGRSLEGYGGSETAAAPGIAGGANYVVFAFQQPFPQDIYRVGFAALYDPRGGILVQPGLQWKVNNNVSVDTFYTYINGHLSNNPNKNLLGNADFGNEVSVRLGYQF